MAAISPNFLIGNQKWEELSQVNFDSMKSNEFGPLLYLLATQVQNDGLEKSDKGLGYNDKLKTAFEKMIASSAFKQIKPRGLENTLHQFALKKNAVLVALLLQTEQVQAISRHKFAEIINDIESVRKPKAALFCCAGPVAEEATDKYGAIIEAIHAINQKKQ